MKVIIFVFSVILVATSTISTTASVAYLTAPTLRTVLYPANAAAHLYSAHSSSLITPSQQQYHTQDEFGQYAYGYQEPLSAKQEVRSLDGTTRGSYSYRDAAGKLQTVAYTADSNGFHVAATNLPRSRTLQEAENEAASSKASTAVNPLSVGDTVEVAAAREAHLAAYEATRLRLAADSTDTIADRTAESQSRTDNYNVRRLELPKPVEDTPIVAAAKAQHLKRLQQEKLRNEIIGATQSSQSQPATAFIRTALPNVYGYGYGYASPLNARILATGYYY